MLAGIEDNESWGITHADALGRTALARLRLARGDLAGAAAALEEIAQRTAGRILPPDQVTDVRDLQMRMWLAAGDLGAVRRWADEWARLAGAPADFRHEGDLLTLARAWIALGQPQPAISLLQRLQAATANRAMRRVECLLLLACAWQAAGQSAQAMDTLEQSLLLAAPIGCLRLFLDEGPAVATMLSALCRGRGVSPAAGDFARQVLAAFQRDRAPVAGVAASVGPAALVEPLTPREQEVLALLAAGHSNQEIADRLVITLHAVKKHTGNIYGKLNVASRTQAIVRARELGLLAG